jgi:hypothetical protein
MRSDGLMMWSGANAGHYVPLRVGSLARLLLSQPPTALFLTFCSRSVLLIYTAEWGLVPLPPVDLLYRVC